MIIERNVPMEILFLVLAVAGCVMVLGITGVVFWAIIQEFSK